MNWNEKRILITGGSSGIGRATIAVLKAKGARLFFCGLEKEKVDAVKQKFQVEGITTDLSTEEGILSTYQQAIDYLGEIDILINNAGFVIARPLEELSRADFEKMYAINAIAPTRLAQLIIPDFKSKQQGDIVNIGATGGHYGFANGAAYASSKAALINISKCMAVELRKHNIRVTHIDPSWTTGTSNDNEGQKINEVEHHLTANDVAQAIVASLELHPRAFIPQMSIWATNPF